MKVVIFLGPPGAGKGSLSQLCKTQLGWRQLSTGNLCRRHINQKTSIGKEIDFAIKSGKLISDSLISDMVDEWFSKEDNFEGVILDGFPRTLGQAKKLQDFLNQKYNLTMYIIKLFISDDLVVQRLNSRFICQNNECQQVYSIANEKLAPKKQMECDHCRSILGRRKDDEETSIRERLRTYHLHEKTLLHFYQEKGLLVKELNVEQPLDKVFEELHMFNGVKGMITIKNKQAMQKMEQAGALLSELFDALVPLVRPGVTTLEIDQAIAENLKARNLTSKTKGYMGYRHVSCISLNEEVVHGVPHANRVLKEGDLVKIDICASWKGYCADMARAFFVGSASEKIKNLVAVAQKALDKGIAQARPGNRLGDISAAIQKEIEQAGYGVVRDFAGHGIGKQMHEDPEILNYGKAGSGPVLRPGMTFAIEPMLTLGNHEVCVLEDGWTVTTKDNSFAAHVEDTIIITEQEPKIITRRPVGAEIGK